MADNKKIVDKRDRNRVSASEAYEMRDLARRAGVSMSLATKATQQAGPMRTNVERKLHQLRGGARHR
ncbi:MAG: DUF3606 domain-containing protein [Myxococcota bacterium]